MKAAASILLGVLSIGAMAQQYGTPESRQVIKNSEFHKLFEKYPVTDSAHPPEFPRVAATIKRYNFDPRKQWSIIDARTVDAKKYSHVCATFDIVIWKDLKNSSKLNDVDICIADTDWYFGFGQGQTWALTMTYPGTNTGQARTMGPNPPGTVYPMSSSSQFLDSDGGHLIMHLMTQLGYVPGESGKRRFWIVDVKSGS